MKTLTNKTLVLAVAMILCATPSMAATELSVQPLSQLEKHTTSATAATSPGPFYALTHVDAQTLAEQEMTDQELKTVEGGTIYQTLLAAKGSFGGYKLEFGEGSLSTTYTLQGSCTCTCTP